MVENTSDKWLCDICKQYIYNVVTKEMHEQEEMHIRMVKYLEEKKKKEDVRFKASAWFKLKDKPSRQMIMINIIKEFGFVPEVVFIEKKLGASSTVRFGAILTDKEKQAEDTRRKFNEETAHRQLEQSKKQLEIDKQKVNGNTEPNPTTTK